MTIQPFEEHAPTYQATDSWVPVLHAVGDLAGKLAATPFVPRAMQRNPAAVAAAILTGREMNLGPMASLRGIDVIEGRPSLTAQMLAARIFAAGHSIEWVNSSDKQCTVRITRGDGLSVAEATWTISDAQRAGLAGKKVWQSYPRHMLRARALSECASMACPDVALGLDVTPDTDTSPVDNRAGGATETSTVQLAPAPVPVELSYDNTYVQEQKVEENSTENPPENDQKPEQLSPAQMRKIGAQIGEYERATGTRLGRDERRAYIAELAGISDLASAKDLTREQASTVIESLTLALAAIPPITDSEPSRGPNPTGMNP